MLAVEEQRGLHAATGVSSRAGVEQLAQVGELRGAVAADRGQRHAARGSTPPCASAARRGRPAGRSRRAAPWRRRAADEQRGEHLAEVGRGRPGLRCSRSSSATRPPASRSALRRFASPWISTGSRLGRLAAGARAAAARRRARRAARGAMTSRGGHEPRGVEPREAGGRPEARAARLGRRAPRGAARPAAPPGRARLGCGSAASAAPSACRPSPRARSRRRPTSASSRSAVLAVGEDARGRGRLVGECAARVQRRAGPWRRRPRVPRGRGTRTWRTARPPTRRGGG